MNKLIEFLKDGENQRKYLKWLLRLTAKSKKSLIGLCILNTAVAVASVLITLVKKSIVDQAQNQVAFRILVIIMGAMYLFTIFGNIIETLLESIITERYAAQIRRDLLERFLKLPWLSRSIYHSEDLVSRITSDVNQITSGVSKLIISVGGLLVRLILAFFLLWNYSRSLASAIIIIAPVGALTSVWVSRGLRKLQKEYQETEAEYRIFLQERLSKVELVQIFGQEDQSIERLQAILDKRLDIVKRKNRWKLIGTGFISMTFVITQAAAFVIGALMVSDGSITFGVMTAFLSLVGQIQGPVSSLASQLPHIVGVLASAGRVMEVSEVDVEQIEPETAVLIENIQGKQHAMLGLRAEDVSIGYKEDEMVVKHAAFDIKPGQMVMLAGRSGIGKTTLLRAIMGFLKTAEGRLNFYTKDEVECACGVGTRRLISYVPQGNTLMFGTIADNLRMGKEDASEEEMKEALKVADALEFVEALPEGIHTKIGEKASGISEGQAQRISIARALLKKSSILILDEATSALDEKTEVKILDAISKSEHQTCLYVSHRRYLEKYADQVIDL